MSHSTSPPTTLSASSHHHHHWQLGGSNSSRSSSVNYGIYRHICAFFKSLTLLVGHQEEHLACKKFSDEVLAWLSVQCKEQMICVWSS